MRLTYSGKTKEFTPELEERITVKLAKLSKLLEQRGEREAHMTHCMEGHLHKVELVVNFYDHPLVAEGLDLDLDAALCAAVEKLEGIALKARSRWRDTHRDSKGVRSSKENWDQQSGERKAEPAAATPEANGTGARKPKVFRVNYDSGHKPMTLEEALLEIEKDDYVVYRDADKNCLSVLLRRPDGNYDLIES
jgi:ribosomal subunit interface protein